MSFSIIRSEHVDFGYREG